MNNPMKQQHRLAKLAPAVLLGIGMVTTGAFSGCANSAPSTTENNQVLRGKLDNGLQVVIVRDTLAPVVTTQVTYRTGSYQTPADYPGMAHAVEHMMFRDSSGMTGSQLHEIMGKMGAGMNAFTADDATQYYFSAPSQYVDLLLKIESTRMRGAQFSVKNWKLESGAIEQEVSSKISNPTYRAFSKARKVMFAGTGYAIGGLGTRSSFDEISNVRLKQFYDRWYQPNNALLVVAGDVDPKATMAKIKQLFGDIPKGDLGKRKPLELKPFQSQTITQKVAKPTGTVQYMYRMPGERSPDYVALKVLVHVLNNDRSYLSDLEAKGDFLSASAGLLGFTHGSMGMISAHFPEGGDRDQLATDLDKAIDHILAHGVSPELVEAVKRKQKADFEFSRDSAAGLASQWSSALVWKGLDSPKQALAKIEAVTPSDVNRVARKYLQRDQRVTLVLIPDPDGERPSNSRGFGGTESFASDESKNVPLPDWAARKLSKLELPQWTLNPVRMELDNGITLIVQPETINKTVVVAGLIETNSDLQAPAGKKGVSALLDKLFEYGTESLDREAFHKAQDAIAASVNSGRGFSLYVPSKSFDRGMQLLADVQLHPALPKASFEVQQKKYVDSLKGRMNSTSHKRSRAIWERLLPAGDPQLREATPESVQSLTLQDVKQYYAKTFRPDMTTIVVAGDVTPEQAKRVVKKYFGQWKASGPKPDTVFKRLSSNKGSYAVVNDSFASQDKVVMAQLVDVWHDDPDQYALTVGNAILGGNSFASRLMHEIRVKHGYAYGAGSSLKINRSRSMFTLGYGSDPDKVKEVDAIILDNIRSMRNELVKEEELKTAKQALIRSIPRKVSSLDGIAFALMRWSYKGLPLDKPMVAARHYMDVDANMVRAAFHEHIHPDNLVQIVTGPKPEEH